MTIIHRQLVAAFGISLALLGVAAYIGLRGEHPVTDADRDRRLAEMEAEHGLTASPGDTFQQRSAKLLAKIEGDNVEQKLNMYRKELEARGYISDPSPDEEAFLQAHKSQLPDLVVKKAQPDVDVELIGWPLKDYMTVESCELDGRLLRCVVKVKPGFPIEGSRIRAKASRWDGAQFVDLAGASVTAPHLMGGGASELVISLPGRVDLVFLSYRQ